MATQPPSGAPGFWTLARVADALRAHADVNLPRDDRPIARVWTDTRSVAEGDLFVALAGERFDAHEFVAQAVAAGAAAVVVSRPMADLGVPVIEVRDTLAALGALGQYRRRAWNRPIVAVAGTNGKTSTKELLRAALGSVLEVHATMGNLNNLVGVPLTLLAIPDSADVAIVEMGTNQPGEVARLRAIVEPTIAVITSVAEEHLEGLGDLAGVLREELDAVTDVEIAVVPSSQPEIGEGARSRARQVVEAGLDGGDAAASAWEIAADGSGVLEFDGTRVDVPLRGVHNLRNAMLALGVARAMGIPGERSAAGIRAMTPPPMRSNVEVLGRVTLINDAYNANPGSTRAALDLLVHAGAGADRPTRQRVAVLGSMLEMGSQSDRVHEEIAREALALPIDLVVGVGDYQAAFARVGGGEGRVITALDADGVWEALESRLTPDAVILLKGSRGVRLERLVPAIATWANAAD